LPTVEVLPPPREAERAGYDADIVQAARGDRRAFERLYRRHASEVHGLCLRMTGRRGLAAAMESAALPLEDVASMASAADDAPGRLDLERAIEQLPEGARHVLVLVGVYGHSHDEAGEMLGIAAGTRRAQLHRARQLLSRQLGLDNPEDRRARVAASFQPPQDQAYRAAHAALEQTFRERLSLLAPATRARIEADLETIRKANADIRAALQQDPASPVLQRLLESIWQQEIDLYRSIARSTDPLSRRT